jgi:serine O-acetyltransferase
MTAPFERHRRSDSLPDLGRIVAELGDIRRRSHRTRYGDGPTPELPSRTVIGEIVEGLVAVLFPRHYGPHGLVGDAIDAFIEDQLAATLEALQHQVRLELGLRADETAKAQVDGALVAHDLVRRFADDLPQVRTLLESDIQAAYAGDPAATSLDEVMCCYPGVNAIIRHRLAHGLYQLGAPMLARIISESAHAATGIDIHPGARIGEGFFIDHGTGVVIGETAIIGRRVRLYQAVTLGARRFEQDGQGALLKGYPRHPIIEDDVVIYAGATILGRITIGQGSTIAGNVWVTSSAPAGSTITQAKARSDGFDDGGGI